MSGVLSPLMPVAILTTSMDINFISWWRHPHSVRILGLLVLPMTTVTTSRVLSSPSLCPGSRQYSVLGALSKILTVRSLDILTRSGVLSTLVTTGLCSNAPHRVLEKLTDKIKPERRKNSFIPKHNSKSTTNNLRSQNSWSLKFLIWRREQHKSIYK